MWAKIRPTVIILAAMGTVLAALCVYWLLDLYMAGSQPSTEVIIALVGVASLCVGGLLTLAGQVAVDHPPSYPAKELPSLIRALKGQDEEGD